MNPQLTNGFLPCNMDLFALLIYDAVSTAANAGGDYVDGVTAIRFVNKSGLENEQVFTAVYQTALSDDKPTLDFVFMSDFDSCEGKQHSYITRINQCGNMDGLDNHELIRVGHALRMLEGCAKVVQLDQGYCSDSLPESYETDDCGGLPGAVCFSLVAVNPIDPDSLPNKTLLDIYVSAAYGNSAKNKHYALSADTGIEAYITSIEMSRGIDVHEDLRIISAGKEERQQSL